MSFNDLITKYKGKSLSELFKLFESGILLFQDMLEDHSELKIKSSDEQLSILLDAMVSVDQGIEDEEIELLGLIYKNYLKNIDPPTLSLITSKQDLPEMYDTYKELIDSVFPVLEHVMALNPDKSSEVKQATMAVFFSLFYANGVLDSKQKEILKKIENAKAVDKEPTLEDLPRLMSEFKAKPLAELADIFVTNTLIIVAAHEILRNNLDDYENHFTKDVEIDLFIRNNFFSKDMVFRFFILVVIGLDSNIDEEEYEFLKAVTPRLSSRPLPSLDELRKEKIVDKLLFEIALEQSLVPVTVLEHFQKGTISAYLNAYLAAFASNRSFSSLQKDILKQLLTAAKPAAKKAPAKAAVKTAAKPAAKAPAKPAAHIDAVDHHLPAFDNATMSIGLNQKESQSGQPLDVSVLDYGGTFVLDDDTYYLSIGAQIHNPNKFYTASRVIIKINVMDASGRVIESENETLYHIDPDTVFNYGNELYFTNGKPSKFQFLATAEGFKSSEDGSKVYDGIDVGDYTFAEESYRGYSIKGQVTSRYLKKLDYVSVYLMFLDSNNKIKGGCNFSIRYMFSNVTEAFSDNVAINLNTISYVRHSIDIY